MEQANLTAKMLKDKQIDIILSSPLKRAKQTAEIINHHLHCPILLYEEAIAERDFGEFEGMHFTEFDAKEFWNYEKNLKFQKAENIRDFFKRIYQAIDQYLLQYSGKNILIVTHGGVSIPFYCYFNGIPKIDDLTSLRSKKL